jgi:uncharacterized protein (DUF169 family)
MSMSVAHSAHKLQHALGLTSTPVAVAFRAEPPPGVPRVEGPMAAGCAYWSHAAEGHVFYTTPEDHYGCPVGAHTHGVSLPKERAHELTDVVGTMLSLEYLREEELRVIPHRVQPLGVAVYAPLSDATFEPDVVVVRGTPRQVMLLSEAARAAGAFDGSATMGRPACAMIPHTEQHQRGVTSLGCIGNRVYTGLGDDELYFAMPGAKVDAITEKVETILRANEALEQFHTARRGPTRPVQSVDA